MIYTLNLPIESTIPSQRATSRLNVLIRRQAAPGQLPGKDLYLKRKVVILIVFGQRDIRFLAQGQIQRSCRKLARRLQSPGDPSGDILQLNLLNQRTQLVPGS
jgi:hypothetical protein